MATRMKPGSAAYHHGDLKATLLEYGIELARAGGPDAVSLRAVQRRAGVSNAAAYRHYADRWALLEAIGNYASARMADAMQEAIGAVPDGPDPVAAARAHFQATGAAYIDFALSEPGLFEIAFLPEDPSRRHWDPADPVPDARGLAGLGPYQLLNQVLDRMVEVGALAPQRRAFSDIAAWSAVHGLAVLLLRGPLSRLDQPMREAAIGRLLEVVQAGTT
jgi:AcrR family transcriptional regulator